MRNLIRREYVLVVADPLPNGRLKRVAEFDAVESALGQDIRALRQLGIDAAISPVFKTPAEVMLGSPHFLDMVAEGRILPRSVVLGPEAWLPAGGRDRPLTNHTLARSYLVKAVGGLLLDFRDRLSPRVATAAERCPRSG